MKEMYLKMEARQKVFICDCGGRLKMPRHAALMSNSIGTYYPHICDKCQKEKTLINECDGSIYYVETSCIMHKVDK